MHWADIIAAVQRAGTTLSAIAKQEEVSVNTVSAVVRGNKTSHPVAYAIAAVTGLTTEQMWPGKYLTPPAYEAARKENTAGRLPVLPNPKEFKKVANG